MGLDSVELVMRIEEEFSIDLPDDEISSVRTVGDLYAVVLGKLKTSPDCLTSRAFYRIRKALVEILGVPRRSIRPISGLDPFFPPEERKRLWSEFSNAIELTIPRLQYSKAWKNRFMQTAMILSTLMVLSVGIALHVLLGLSVERQMAGLLYWAFAAILWIFLFTISDLVLLRWTTFLRTEIPVVNVGELSRMVLALNPSDFAPEAAIDQSASKDQVWIKLVQIFSDQLQLNPEEIVPNATIAEDLGVC